MRALCLAILIVASCGGPPPAAVTPAPASRPVTPAPASAPAASQPIIGDGTLSKARIKEVLASHRSEVRVCYERELLKNPDLGGLVVVKFVIGPTGSVRSAEIASSTLGSAPVEECITRAFLGWTFPPPLGGGIVIVSYPYKLRAANPDGM